MDVHQISGTTDGSERMRPRDSGGGMAARLRAFDWSMTPLGPMDRWPHSLRTAVAICLSSRFPMFLWWGPNLVNIYNDAYVPILGLRHPDALGRSAPDVWRDVWQVVGPQVEAVMTRGEASWHQRVPLVLERNGFAEEAFFTWSHSMVPDERGGVGGVLCVVTEETASVLAERERDRLATCRQVALDAAAMGWWHYDPQTKLATYDRRYCEIFGVTGTSQPNEAILKRLHPDDLPGVWARVEAALDPLDPKPYSAEYRIVMDDGSIRRVEAHGRATFEGAGDHRQAVSFVGTVADVTERRRVEDRPRVILESVTDAFFAVDGQWRFTYLNTAAERLLLRNRDELLGRSVWDEFPQAVDSTFDREYRRAVAEQVTVEFEEFYPPLDAWFGVRAYPSPDGLSVYFRNVTERRRVEQRLRTSEERLALAVGAADLGTFYCPMPLGKIEWNDTCKAHFWLPPDAEIDFDLFYSIIHPDDRERTRAAVERAVYGREAYDVEYRTVASDGRQRWVRAKGRAYHDPGGNPVRFDGVTLDVTDARRAEEALRASEQRWELAVGGTNDGIWDWNPVTDELYWSPRCKGMLGYADDELQVSREVVRDLMHPDDREVGWAETRRHLAGQTPHFTLAYRLRHKDGSYRWVEARGVAVRDADGKPFRMAGSHTDITDRRATEESLRRTTARLQLAVDALGLGLWSLDLTDDSVEESDRFVGMLGLPPGTRHRTAEEWGKYLHPDDVERATRKFEGALAGTCEYDDEQRLVGADGATRWVHAKGAVVRDPSGRPVRIIGVVADITRRREDERARAHLAAVVESSDDVIVSKTLEGVIQTWNAGATRVFGYTAEEAVGKPVLMLLPPERQAEEADILARLRRGERIEHFESVRVAKDGRRIDVALTISPIRDADGRIVGASKIARDITRQKLSEARLREESNAVETINHIGRSVAAELDLERLVQTVVDETTRLTGGQFGAFFYNVVNDKGESYALYAIAGVDRSHFDKFPMPRNTDVFAPTFAGDRIVRLDDVTSDPRYGKNAPYHGMPEGHLPVRSYLAVPVTSRSGEVLGGLFFGHEQVGVFAERHERLAVGIASQAAVAIDNARLFEAARRANAEKDRLLDSERAARAEAERQSRLKDEFVSTMSHELRTPLNAILGYAQLLHRDPSLSEDAAEGLGVIERNARVQAQIVEDILDVSRLVAGKMRLDVQRVDLPGVIGSALETCKPSADAKGIGLVRLIDPLAGPVGGDPARLQQCIWNLVANSIKFSPKGARVQVVLQRVNSHVEIAVSDTGQGIKPEFLPHVFERFRQEDGTTTRRAGGLGLGLSIVKSLVELHGGSVKAHSDGEGRGATFTISLPLAALHADDAGPDREHPTAPRAAPSVGYQKFSLKDVTVLAVDDEPDARELVRRLLEECGATVITAGSADEAIGVLDGGTRINLLLSDVGMPEMDGYGLMEQVRRRPPERGGDLPAVALTAYARSEDRTRAMVAGFTGHVAKPVEPAELVATIAALARRSKP